MWLAILLAIGFAVIGTLALSDYIISSVCYGLSVLCIVICLVMLSIGDDCEKMGMFRVGNVIYQCQLIQEPK